MFALTPEDLRCSILDCAGGPASFNVEMTRKGYKVVSCDPVYQFTVAEIQKRLQDTYQVVIDGVQANWDNYVWLDFQSPAQLGQLRMATMQQFLADFPLGLQEGRYVTDELPVLSFNTAQFDLALCSHFLFLYSDQLSAEFHLNSILEMARVATEVRIFPLLDISCEPSPWLPLVTNELEQRGYTVEIKQVPYEFQKGGNKLLRVNSQLPSP